VYSHHLQHDHDWLEADRSCKAEEEAIRSSRKSVGYDVPPGTKCVDQLGNETFTVGDEEKLAVVNATYLEAHVPFVRDRLKGLESDWRAR
jgi:hypothetical protein